MQTLIHNTLNSFGIATIHGYDAAIPAAVGELWGAGQSKGLGQHVLRLTGTEYAILPIDDPGERVERRQGLEPMLDPLPGARLYRVPGALPRVYLAGRAELVFDDEAKRRLLDQEVVAGGLALLASDPGGAVTVGLDAPASRAGECRLTSFSNVRVIATCRVDRPAIAVFNEQHDAGWTAQVDGLAAPLLRANLLMRAVWLDRGAHTVILSYTPPGLRGGLVVSSAALCVLAGLALAPLARHRRSRAVRS